MKQLMKMRFEVSTASQPKRPRPNWKWFRNHSPYPLGGQAYSAVVTQFLMIVSDTETRNALLVIL